MAGGSRPFLMSDIPDHRDNAGSPYLDLSVHVQVTATRSSNQDIERGRSWGTEVLIGGWHRRQGDKHYSVAHPPQATFVAGFPALFSRGDFGPRDQVRERARRRVVRGIRSAMEICR